MGKHIISIDEALADNVRLVDARWFLPNSGRDGASEYALGHIPGAVFFPLEEVITPHSDHPHRAPSPARMAEWLGSVGISPKDDVVVYDETGFFSAPRVWFLMKALGHEHARVLDRGLQGWKEEGGELTAKVPTVTPSSYPLSENLAWPVVERRAVQAAIEGAADIQIA
ncbi:MAG: rhodanese-like domain-containing protein, partial [Pseudomonadota bacterium]